MSDMLKIGTINNMPQPIIVTFVGKEDWPLIDIDVESGLMRIDVCGKSQIKHIGEAIYFTDGEHIKHPVESLYLDEVLKGECDDHRN